MMWESEGRQGPYRRGLETLLTAVAVTLATVALTTWVYLAWRVRPLAEVRRLAAAATVVSATPWLVGWLAPELEQGRLRSAATATSSAWEVGVGPLVSEPVLAGDVAVMWHADGCGVDGAVDAFATGTGERRWHRAVSRDDSWTSQPVPETPTVVGDAVVMADGDTVVAVEASTGAERWTSQGEATFGPVSTGTHAVVITERMVGGSGDEEDVGVLRSTVQALDGRDGGLAWSVDLADTYQTLGVWADGATVTVSQWGPVGVVAGTVALHRIRIEATTGAVLGDDVVGGAPRVLRPPGAARAGVGAGGHLSVLRGEAVGCGSD
jgi:hypothetical protein